MPRALVALVLAGSVVASCTARDRTTDPTRKPARPASSGPGPSSEPLPAPELDLRLVKVSARGVDGEVHAPALGEPSERVRRTLEGLYLASLAGRRGALSNHFAGQAREQVRSATDRLLLSSADPDRAILKLRFLADAQGRPLVAFAEVAFEGSATRDGRPARVEQRGDFVLRRIQRAWRVVSYAVHRRVARERSLTSFIPTLSDPDPMFILVIGSDARPGAVVTRTRADSIHIVGVNPRRGLASIVGIPRDSWVVIPGAGADKINAALVRGGPELLVQTVERLAGIHIDGYVVTGFDGFTQIVDAVGGFDIEIPYAIDDALARAEFARGPDHLDGRDALALARARHDVPAGDFGRSLNQGRLMLAALGTLRTQATGANAALLPWVLAGLEHVRSNLSIDELFELVLAATAFEPRDVSNSVAPGGTGRIGSRSVVFLGSAASVVFRDLGRDGVVGRAG